MIPEDRRKAVARMKATRTSPVEQMVVLAAGVSALLLFLVV
jgi:hypothetical protein